LAKLLYIGGYGRSGSTLLEYLLARHPDLVACGEIERHLRNFTRKKMCTCGQRVHACPIWGAFQHKKGRLRGWDHERLTLALLQHVSFNYTVMVDSSKTAWGSAAIPFRLFRQLGPNFLLVHIVRDPRAVSWSGMRTPWRSKKSRRGSPFSAALRATFGWMAANLACEFFRWRQPNCYIRVRYEDLIHDPDRVVADILRGVSLAPLTSLQRNQEQDNRHQLHGNAMRFRPMSPSELKEDNAWKAAMPKAYRQLVAVLCWPWLIRYGYNTGSRR
jgi:hypothetical protein